MLDPAVTQYDESSTLALARARYFEVAGLEPGYEARWVKLKVGPLPLAFPNAAGRRRAVQLHDLHHIATDYDTSWTGEAEISAWEIASGCAHHLWAWGLDLGGLAVGLVIAPRRCFRAFVRGCHSTNLYRTVGEYEDALLERTVGALRRDLALRSPEPAATASDRLRFGLWTGACVLTALGPPALLVALAAWTFA